jgi:hypothetical protein
MLIEACRRKLHDALLGIAENRNASAFDSPGSPLLPPSPRVPEGVFTEVQMLAIGTFLNQLNCCEKLRGYSFRESRFPSLGSKMLYDR